MSFTDPSQPVTQAAPTQAPAVGQAVPNVSPPTASIQDLQALLPDDLKSNPMLSPFKDIASLAKSYVDTKSLVGANTLKKPTQFASDADRADFMRKAFDVPAELDKYDVKFPDGVPKEDRLFNEMKKLAYDMGIPGAEFTKLANKYTEVQKSQMGEIEVNLLEKQKTEWNHLKTVYGAAFEQKMLVADAALKELGGRDYDAIKTEMLERGWANSPWLAETLVRVGEFMFTEDKIAGLTKGGKLTDSPAEAQAKLNEIYGNADHPYRIANHPNHKAAVDEVLRLTRLTVGAT